MFDIASYPRFFIFLCRQLCIALAITALWNVLFHLNHAIFSNSAAAEHVNWVFLPAVLRLVSILLFGWTGFVGVFLGSMTTTFNEPMLTVVGMSLASSLSPLLAVRFCQWGFKMTENLEGISPWQLITMALLASFMNAALLSTYFYYTGISVAFIPMFVGDFIGSMLVLYLAKLGLAWLTRRAARQALQDV